MKVSETQFCDLDTSNRDSLIKVKLIIRDIANLYMQIKDVYMSGVVMVRANIAAIRRW